MARRRKPSGAGIFVLFVLGAIGFVVEFVSTHPEILILGAVALVIWILYKVAQHGKTSGSSTSAVIDNAPTRSRSSRSAPIALSSDGSRYWIGLGRGGVLQGRQLGALIYLGSGLKGIASDAIEPALIDPRLAIAKGIRSCQERTLEYWPSYTTASARARASYLHWLQTGRADPQADIGYVFLYFYGLERRALHDARVNPELANEIEGIEREVHRLLSIYQEQASFRSYGSRFLDFLHVQRVPPQCYRSSPRASLLKELSLSDRLALAQCADDGAALPAEWAQHWLAHDRSVALGTPARRCPREFSELFRQLYRERFGDGMKLPRNRTALVLQYRAASASFHGSSEDLTCSPGLSDVSVLASPVRELAEIASTACERLGRFSRTIAKDPSAAQSFEALVELPVSLWPETYRQQLQHVRDLVARAGQPAAVPFEKFRSWIPEFEQLTRSKLKALSTALAGFGLGMEPDLRFGGGVPALTSRVVVFADDPESAPEEASPRYLGAALTLQLAAAVAMADGDAGKPERELVMHRMNQWPGLRESERRRLRALVRLLFTEPPKLVGLRKKMEVLSASARKAIGDFLVQVAHADEQITPEKIRTLQKTFALLGLNPEQVFSKVHAAATHPSVAGEGLQGLAWSERYAIRPPPPSAQESHALATGLPAETIRLDPRRIAVLQKDSERVAELLSPIFASAESSLSKTEPEEAESREESTVETSLLGLDARHTSLLKALLMRVEWTRAEVTELAEDRNLMAEGAIERLNEASLEALGMPLFDETDPIRLNHEAIEGIESVEHSRS
jgi:uncharacterized tellurite resistance protein B-like protein